MCHCGAVVKEFLARADEPGSTPGDAVFCYTLNWFFFPVWSLFLNTIFPFGLFFFILTADPTGHAQTLLIYTQHPPATHWRKLNLPFLHRLNHQYYYPKISTGLAPKK